MNAAEVINFASYAESKVNPQVENGYIRIANELFETIISHPFTKQQLKIVLAVLRKTYGYGKKMDELSLSQLAEMTKLKRSHCSEAIKALVVQKVLIIESGKHAQRIGLNKHYDQWEIYAVPETGTVPKTGTDHSRNGNHNKQLPKDKERDICPTVLDETLHDAHIDSYKAHLEAVKKEQAAAAKKLQDKAWDEFWKEYPRKVKKPTARKAWNKLPIDRDLYVAIYTAIKRQKQAGLFDEAQYTPHPSSWLNAERWTDEIDTSAAAKDDPLAAYAGRLIKK